jgi:hypothetical protein
MDLKSLSTRISLSPEGLGELQNLYDHALQVGPSVAAYLVKLVTLGYMEQRIVGGARALLSLQKSYDKKRLDNACKRALMGSKCNFEIIKNILLNNMDLTPLKSTIIAGNKNTGDAEHLRGSESFKI